MRALFAVIAALVLAACSDPPVIEKAPRTVLTTVVSGASVPSVGGVYTGEVRARNETDLAFRIGGKMLERLVDIGASVKRGEVLARLDGQDTRFAANAAGAQVEAAAADLALARAELVRSEGLHARNFVSASALGARRTQVQAAEARLRQARAQASVAGNQADYTTLRADRDGIITAAPAEAGEVVSAGQPVLRLAQPSSREILIHVPEGRVRELRVGAVAQVRAWAHPAKVFVGALRELSPAADATTRTYAARVSVPDADDALPLGATASVAFAAEDGAYMVVPLPALTRMDGKAVVWVVDESSRTQPLEVEAGKYREDGVEIRAGLPVGARIVTAGVHRLVAGERVRAVDAAASVALDAKR